MSVIGMGWMMLFFFGSIYLLFHIAYKRYTQLRLTPLQDYTYILGGILCLVILYLSGSSFIHNTTWIIVGEFVFLFGYAMFEIHRIHHDKSLVIVLWILVGIIGFVGAVISSTQL
jgi:hypothetical protein